MSENGMIPWKSLERWSSKLFLLGAVILALNSGIVFYDVIEGTELRLPLGQVFVGTGWAATLLGTLGLYPDLVDRKPWLARASALFAAIGVIGYLVMAVIFAAAVAGLPESTVEALTPVFLPAVLAGTFLAFPLFGVTTLVTGARSRTVGVLLGAPAVIFVANVLSGPSAESIFVVLVALVLVYGSIGYLLRADGVSADQTSTPTETSV